MNGAVILHQADGFTGDRHSRPIRIFFLSNSEYATTTFAYFPKETCVLIGGLPNESQQKDQPHSTTCTRNVQARLVG